MSNIDRQRRAAVRTLEDLGFSYRGGDCWEGPVAIGSSSPARTAAADALYVEICGWRD